MKKSLLEPPPAETKLQLKLSQSPRLLLRLLRCELTWSHRQTFRVERTFLRVVRMILAAWLLEERRHCEGRPEGQPGVRRLQQVCPVQGDCGVKSSRIKILLCRPSVHLPGWKAEWSQ